MCWMLWNQDWWIKKWYVIIFICQLQHIFLLLLDFKFGLMTKSPPPHKTLLSCFGHCKNVHYFSLQALHLYVFLKNFLCTTCMESCIWICIHTTRPCLKDKFSPKWILEKKTWRSLADIIVNMVDYNSILLKSVPRILFKLVDQKSLLVSGLNSL